MVSSDEDKLILAVDFLKFWLEVVPRKNEETFCTSQECSSQFAGVVVPDYEENEEVKPEEKVILFD